MCIYVRGQVFEERKITRDLRNLPDFEVVYQLGAFFCRGESSCLITFSTCQLVCAPYLFVVLMPRVVLDAVESYNERWLELWQAQEREKQRTDSDSKVDVLATSLVPSHLIYLMACVYRITAVSSCRPKGMVGAAETK